MSCLARVKVRLLMSAAAFAAATAGLKFARVSFLCFDSLIQQCRIVIGEGAVVGIAIVSLVEVLGPVRFFKMRFVEGEGEGVGVCVWWWSGGGGEGRGREREGRVRGSGPSGWVGVGGVWWGGG